MLTIIDDSGVEYCTFKITFKKHVSLILTGVDILGAWKVDLEHNILKSIDASGEIIAKIQFFLFEKKLRLLDKKKNVIRQHVVKFFEKADWIIVTLEV